MIFEVLDYDTSENLLNFAFEEFREKFNLANRLGTLEDLLEKCGLDNSLNKYYAECTNYGFCSTPKYVLIGSGSHLKKQDIENVFKEFNISPADIELNIEFDKLKKLKIEKYRDSDEYAHIFVCATQHKTEATKDYSSMITRLEQEDGFPPITRLTANNQLKITISNLREALNNLFNS